MNRLIIRITAMSYCLALQDVMMGVGQFCICNTQPKYALPVVQISILYESYMMGICFIITGISYQTIEFIN